jgi:GT2 family glycosyltransferase
VIIAAYNAETTLSEALASVAAQSNRPGSVVVVDDASDDATAEVARTWQGVLPVRLISHRLNVGPSEARRSGIDATGEPLIAILDADDIWLPDHLELMLSTYHAARGLVTADAFRWMPGQGLNPVSYRQTQPIPDPPRQRVSILTRNFVFTSVLFARADYTAVGGYRAGFVGTEDWDLWIRMTRAGLRVTGTRYPTMLYRVHAEGLSRRGEQQLQNEIGVLDLAINEAVDREERAAAKRGLRILRARLSLTRAYANARNGDIGAARTAALRALFGPRAIALRAAVMVLAPGPAVRFRDRREWQPSVKLHR